MKRFVFPLILASATAPFTLAAYGQEFRATITGRVADSTGAVVPNAQITITNEETGVKTPSVSNGDGQYTVPYLLPGKYTVSVTSKGFNTYSRNGITLQSGERIAIDVPLALGSESIQVNVSADASLLQTQSATSGQVLTPEEIENLPDNGRSPLALAKTEFAVVPKQKNSVVQARPFDNSAASDFSIGGGASQSNEYLLNGVPNMQNSSRLPGFSPFQDSVAEIRVDVFQADASYGDTSNGTINLITKSGGNHFHGTVSEFNQFSAINAPIRWFQPSTKQLATRQNQYGGTIGGPVWIPKIFNGHDKLFFFYAYEGFKGSQPTPNTVTVPTVAERNGDFSALLAISPNYQLYNPFTATANGTGGVVRTPIPGNNFANAGLALNPVAKAYLNYLPLPNVPGNSDGTGNFASALPVVNNYSSNEGRLDYNLNDNNRFFFETHRSQWISLTGQVFPNISSGSNTYTVHQGGVIDFVHTFSPKYTLDTRAGLTRTYANSTLLSNGTQAASLGLPGYLNQPGAPTSIPVVAFSDSAPSTAPTQSISANPGSNTAFDTISFFSALTSARGSHTLKAGVDIRYNKSNIINLGNASNLIINGANVTSGATSGSFTFANTFLSHGTGFAAPTFGGAYASFLLGIPTSGVYNINPKTTYNSQYFAGFLQDDWKATQTLSINAGIRFESESSINESNNKASWFDPGATNSAAAPAALAYAAKPIAQLPAASFNANGGLVFAGTGGRRVEFFTPKMYFSPRIGLSFAPAVFHQKVVAHAGFGLLYSPFNDFYTPQTYGFSSTTTYTSTNDNFITPAASLSNPFPTANPIVQPTGSSLGANTYLGQTISIRAPKVKGPYVERWSLDVQYQLTPNTMIQVGYIGAHGVNSTYTNLLSAVGQLPFLSRQPLFDSATQGGLTSSATNPFKGVAGETGTLATASTIPVFQLLQTLPQYNSISQQLVPGSSTLFHELAVRVQKRTSKGLTVNFNYQWSHNLSTSQLNNGGPLFYGENASDFPTHVSVAASYLLPIGRGKTFLGHSNHFVDAIIGGFTVNTIYTYLSGSAIQWGGPGGAGQPYFANGTSYNKALKIRPRDFINGAVDKTLFAATALQPTAYNLRTFPLFYGRQDGTNALNASILKDFHFSEKIRLQYRFEAYNVINHTQFGAPNVTPSSSSLGAINSIVGLPRVLQQGIRVVF